MHFTGGTHTVIWEIFEKKKIIHEEVVKSKAL
jgi:hypothetical protein